MGRKRLEHFYLMPQKVGVHSNTWYSVISSASDWEINHFHLLLEFTRFIRVQFREAEWNACSCAWVGRRKIPCLIVRGVISLAATELSWVFLSKTGFSVLHGCIFSSRWGTHSWGAWSEHSPVKGKSLLRQDGQRQPLGRRGVTGKQGKEGKFSGCCTEGSAGCSAEQYYN